MIQHDAYSYLDISWRSALLLCLVCPIVVTATTLFFRSIETAANRYLGAFLLVFCLNIVPQIIGFAGFYQAFPWLTFAPFNNELWLGPLLLLHALSLTKHKTPSYLWVLLLPAVFQTFYYIIAFTSLGSYQDKWAYNDAVHSVYILPVESIFTIGVSLFCALLAFKHIKLYQSELLDIESDQTTYDTSWLGWMISLVGALVALWSTYEILYLVVTDMNYIDQYPFHILLLCIVLILGQRALSAIKLPFPKPVVKDDSVQDGSESEKVDEKRQALINGIKKGLSDSKWHLNHRFSLSDMARALNSNETYVSNAIKLGFDTNFNTLINGARVTQAKQILQQNPEAKLIFVMADAGFNSKASFNRCFKSMTGLTPSQYQAQIKQIT